MFARARKLESGRCKSGVAGLDAFKKRLSKKAKRKRVRPKASAVRQFENDNSGVEDVCPKSSREGVQGRGGSGWGAVQRQGAWNPVRDTALV